MTRRRPNVRPGLLMVAFGSVIVMGFTLRLILPALCASCQPGPSFHDQCARARSPDWASTPTTPPPRGRATEPPLARYNLFGSTGR